MDEETTPTTPKKKTAKKTVAKSTKTTAKKTSRTRKTSSSNELTEVARETMVKNSRKWASGRERDELLKAAGYDPAEVRAEVQRLREKDIHGGDS